MPFWEAIISGVVPLSVVALLKSAPFSINRKRTGDLALQATMHDHTSFLSLPVCEEKNGSAVGMVDVMGPDPGLRRGKRGLALDLFDCDGHRRGRLVGRREPALDGQHQQE